MPEVRILSFLRFNCKKIIYITNYFRTVDDSGGGDDHDDESAAVVFPSDKQPNALI